MKITIIVPAFNEEKVIRKVLKELKRELKILLLDYEILVIDDGSTDKTKKEAIKEGVKVISHPINRGLGGALGTGLAYCKLNNSSLMVTFDSDGQHDPKDIKRVISPILQNKADVVIGSRTLKGMNKIPLDRRVIIWGSNQITRLFFGFVTSDSQSGLRAFSKRAIKNINIITQGMEVSTEFFKEVKNHDLKIMEVPIKVIYTEYSRTKGQSNLNAFSVFARLLLRLAR